MSEGLYREVFETAGRCAYCAKSFRWWQNMHYISAGVRVHARCLIPYCRRLFNWLPAPMRQVAAGAGKFTKR